MMKHVDRAEVTGYAGSRESKGGKKKTGGEDFGEHILKYGKELVKNTNTSILMARKYSQLLSLNKKPIIE